MVEESVQPRLLEKQPLRGRAPAQDAYCVSDGHEDVLRNIEHVHSSAPSGLPFKSCATRQPLVHCRYSRSALHSKHDFDHAWVPTHLPCSIHKVIFNMPVHHY